METAKKYFNTFELDSYIQEPSENYSLFPTNENNILYEQLKLIRGIEKKFEIMTGYSFKNQVHFQHASKTPVQRWFPYREGYSAQLVSTFLKELNIKNNVFDPFCGSGTTLLASRWNNLKSWGIDINPISVLVAKVENTPYSEDDIGYLKTVIDDLKKIQKTDELFETKFELAHKVFNREILQTLLTLKKFIEKIENHKIRELIFVAWLAIIEKVSNIKKEGNGIKYKNRKRTPYGYTRIKKETWEHINFPEDKLRFVINELKTHLKIILHDLKNNYGNIQSIPEIFQGNSLEFDKFFNAETEFTFFSPPYCNFFDYFEIHKVELWIGEFVQYHGTLRKLRQKAFRSNSNAIVGKPVCYRHTVLEKLIGLFDYENLWSKSIPTVVQGYFDDMHTLLKKLFQKTTQNGYVGIVVGNSAYSGVVIPTDLIISDIAQNVGFRVKYIFITRHLTTSSQQRRKLEFLKGYLRESIILLQKP